MTVSVCLSACLCTRAYLRNHTYDRHQFLCMLTRSSSGSAAIRYVLPVLRMTSYLHAMGHMQECRCDTEAASLKVQPGG